MHPMKKIWISLTLVGVAVFALVIVDVARAGKGGGSSVTAQAQIGLSLAPLPLNLRGLDQQVVGYGAYLVATVGNCNDCHSTQQFATGGDPFLGQTEKVNTATYLRGGRSFGPFVSRNLRPEIGTGLPAGLTYPQFAAVMRHGTDFDNPGQLLQVMPWAYYQNMIDDDLAAIYVYLSALPPVPAGG